MADENVIGLAMQLDVTDLKAGIKEVNSIIKDSKDEFKNATAGMDKWSKSSEGLTAKLDQLNKQMDAQQKAVAGYEAEIERVKNLEGDHTVQLAELSKKLQKAQADVKNTSSQISHYSDSLKTVSRAEKEAGSELGKLTKTINDQQKELGELEKDYKNAVIQFGKNSKEAKNLASKIKDVSGSLEDNQKKVANADKAFEGLNRSLADVGQKAAEKAVKGLAKVGTAVGGLVTAFLATAEGTREFRTNMGKVDTAFKDTGKTAKQAEETYKKFYGILGDEGQATEATALLGELATSQQDLNKWADISTGVYAKFGDSLPIEGLIEAANETAKTGEITGGLADALNWAGLSEDDFQKSLDGCSNEQERQKLITETLNKTYKDASNTYKETNKDIIASQEAQAGLSQAMADIGAKAEPLMTQVKLLGTQLLEAFLPVLEKIIPAIQNNLPLVIGVVGTLVGSIGALSAAVAILKVKTELATVATIAKTTAEKIAAGTTKALTLAQTGLNAAMKANPIGIVITLITALVAAFVVLWKKSDAFRNFWIGLWEGIKKTISTVVNWIKKNWKSMVLFLMNPLAGLFKYFYDNFEGFRKVVDNVTKKVKEYFSKAWEGVKKAWGKAGQFFKDIYTKITNALKNIPSKIKEFFSKAWDGAKNAWSKVTSFFSGIKDKIVSAFKNIPSSIKKFFSDAWNGIKLLWKDPKQFFTNVKDNILGSFKDLPSKLKEVGKNLVEGLWNGIKDMVGWITGKLKGFSGDVLGGIKKFFKVNSPSKATEEIGGYLAEGLAQGIEEGADDVVQAGTKVGEGFTSGVNAGVGSFTKLTSTIDRQKEKLERLEKQYKSVVLTFGATSKEANGIGTEIIALSREIENNETKVKNLDTAYQNLNTTLENQMRVELNNAKNNQKALEDEKARLNDLYMEAGRAHDYKLAEKYSLQISELNEELNGVNSTVKELTANLDYMDSLKKKSTTTSTEATGEAEKEKNAYEKLIETIDQQKKKLEELKSEYSSAIIQYGEHSEEADNLAEQLKKVTAELSENENQVKSLEASYNGLFKTTDDKGEDTVPDTRKDWQKFIDNMEDAFGISEDKLDKWSKSAGKYIDKVAGYMESVGSKMSELFDSISDYFDKKVSARIDEIDKAVEALKETNEKETSAAQESADNQLEILNKMYDKEEISAEEYRNKKKKIEDELAKYTEKKNKEAQEQEKKLLQEKDRLARKQFESQQATEIAMATVNGASAIVKGFAELGPIAGAINAVTQGAITAAQIATIAAQKYVPMLAKGGVVNGATLAMIGENGKEAVMPLERNTGWINELAQKLNDIMSRDMLGSMNAGVPAYAMAGKTTINNTYNQTINSPKSLTRREIYRDSKNLLALKG